MIWLIPALGLLLLLAGMAILTAGLRHARGAERLFARMQGNGVSAFAAGLFGTVLIQSSSASTVLIAGAYDAGRLGTRQTAAAIVGANIGTTLTGWLFCLGLGESVIIPAAVLALACPVLYLRGRRAGLLTAGGLLCILLALRLIGQAEAAVSLTQLIGTGSPLSVFARTTGLTAVIQSSAACIAFVQASAASGALRASSAVAAVLGVNVGTCATALLASIPAGRGAKRAAWMHLAYNLLAVPVMALFCLLAGPYLPQRLSAYDVAAINSLSNLLLSIALLPVLFREK